MSHDPDDTGHTAPIRDAATIVLVRDGDTENPKVLMGQRGARAAFMPSKYVFPGGAVDPDDRQIELATGLPEADRHGLTFQPVTQTAPSPEAMAAAVIRELWEEAGLMLGTRAPWTGPLPEDWAPFAEAGLRPSAANLRYLFRAVTPPGRTRRFDARFFLARAEDIDGDLDDFSLATDELSHLHWIELSQARKLDLPFITEVVLAEADAKLRAQTSTEDDLGVPFFDNSGASSLFRRIT